MLTGPKISGMDHISLLKILADGHFHSGDQLGGIFGVSRAAVWKAIRQIQDQALEIHCVRGKGYRLAKPLELLDKDKIHEALSPEVRQKIRSFHIHNTVESTNSLMMQDLRDRRLKLADGKVHVCLAEQQTAGRGRRGREWISPFARNMYLSVGRGFNTGVAGLEGLSLVVAIAVVRALRLSGYDGIGVKWPNDVLWMDRKLAGILLEMSGDIDGECQVVIGIGLNIDTPVGSMEAVKQPWVNLSEIGSVQSRNHIVSRTLDSLVQVLEQFARAGFSPFRREWSLLDVYAGREITVDSAGRQLSGLARGVNDQGALRLETPEGVKLFSGGEVSLRRQHPKVTVTAGESSLDT